MLKLDLVELANSPKREREMAKERQISISKAKAYSALCLTRQIGNWIIAIAVVLLIGLVGTMELNATPEMVKANKAKETENYYPTTGIITTVSTEFVVFTDFNGNEWMIEDSPEDWECGDICSVIMDSNGTDIIYDDSVVSTKYSGWIY